MVPAIRTFHQNVEYGSPRPWGIGSQYQLNGEDCYTVFSANGKNVAYLPMINFGNDEGYCDRETIMEMVNAYDDIKELWEAAVEMADVFGDYEIPRIIAIIEALRPLFGDE